MSRRLRQEEGGFTIVEVMIAALILILGAIATFGILASAEVSSQRAKATQVALDRAQQELELLRSLSDDELALTSAPPPSTEQDNPNFRVSGNKFALKRSPVSESKPMVLEGGVRYPDEEITEAAVSPGPTPFTSGDVKGKIYRYIVWRNDTSCAAETCPGEQDYKTIVVAVKLDPKSGGGNPGGYVEVQSNFVDPERSAADNPIPGAEGVVTAQQFFFSDTPCVSGEAIRQEISSDHPLHNTLGTCASGAQTGSTLGAPDALLIGPPPDPTPEDVSTPFVYDYSSDYEKSITAETAKGIQLRRDITTGCHYTPEDKTAPQWRVHRWVTDPMAKEFRLTSGESLGTVTIDFFVRAINDLAYTGKMCIYLFKREESGTTYKDTMITNREGGAAYWTFVPSWQNSKNFPYGAWGEVIQTLYFNGPVKIPAGARLGVAFSLDASTQTDAVSILYDHPQYRSRIEVDTTTPIEGG